MWVTQVLQSVCYKHCLKGPVLLQLRFEMTQHIPDLASDAPGQADWPIVIFNRETRLIRLHTLYTQILVFGFQRAWSTIAIRSGAKLRAARAARRSGYGAGGPVEVVPNRAGAGGARYADAPSRLSQAVGWWHFCKQLGGGISGPDGRPWRAVR